MSQLSPKHSFHKTFTDNGPVTALMCWEDPTKPYKCNPAPGRQNTEQSRRSQPQLVRVGPAAPVASLISLALIMSVHLLRIIVVTVILILTNENHSNVSKCKTISFGRKCSVICHMESIPHRKKRPNSKIIPPTPSCFAL